MRLRIGTPTIAHSQKPNQGASMLAYVTLIFSSILIGFVVVLLYRKKEALNPKVFLAAALLNPGALLVRPWIRGAQRQVALWTAVTVLALAAMEVVTRDVYFSREDGRPLKYYIQTLDGYQLAAAPGIDPVYGIPYKPVTTEVAR